ncbi:MAG: DMT family transporter [Rhodobacteraceae bacterium]|nr:DMT family transporter [Paracoccaceae bacterium]
MDNLRGSLLMVAAMAGFALEDVFLKRLTGTLPTGQVLIMLGLGGTLVFGLVAWARGARLLGRQALARPVLLRNAGEMLGTVGFVTALALAPISVVSAILQALPLAVTMGAALMFGEKVGWRRWSAITVGFAGMLLIVRPFGAGFEPGALFAILAVVGLGLRDLATRQVDPTTSSAQLSAWALMAVAVAGVPLLLLAPGPEARIPGPAEWRDFGFVLLFGVAAYACLTGATRAGDVSVIAPFRYTRLVFALILGAIVFSEVPDGPMLAGSAMIIGSGLYTFFRERRLARRPPLPPGPRVG